MNTFYSGWPPLAVTAGYYIALYALLFLGMQQTSGQLVYPLDDTYIHMAMARNFAEHSVWGFTAHAFSSSTSSPLWTALLAAGYAIVGTHDWLPLVLNIVIGTALIFYLSHLIQQNVGPIATCLFLAVIVSVTSLPALTVIGMEHLLHIFLTVAFVFLSVQVIIQPEKNTSHPYLLLLIAALLSFTRYEGLFGIATICLFLCLQRRFRYALLLGTAGIIPLVIYGAIATYQGWLPIPNSVLLKGTPPALTSFMSILDSFGLRAIKALLADPQLLSIFTLALIGFFYRAGHKSAENDQLQWLIMTFLCLLLLHLQFARTGWLFRYEAYLVTLGLMVTLPVLVWLTQSIKNTMQLAPLARFSFLLIAVSLLTLALPLGKRMVFAFTDTAKAMHDRYLEHIQPSRFVRDYYPQSTIIVNDIGAIAYFTDNPLLDMYGLGNIEPVLFRRSETGYGKKEVQAWATEKQAEIAILQIEWKEISKRIPDEWIKVSEWEIPRNVVFGDKRIGFFAVNTAAAGVLATRIAEFADELPKDIKVTMMAIHPPATPN